MRSILNPQWLFIINSLPIALLFLLYYGQFNIIKSLLNEESIQLWKSFAIALGTLGITNCVYAIYITIKQQKVSLVYSIVALFAYIFFIYQYSIHLNEIVPRSIPRWMMPGNLYLYAGTFLMPTLAYALFVLVICCTPNSNKQSALPSFLISVILPIMWYIFLQIILPLWQIAGYNYQEHVTMILIVSGIILFLFFFIRTFYIVIYNRAEWFKSHQLLWKIPFTIILPVIGLLLNNGFFFNDNFELDTDGIFGNFSSIWFYILTFLNGFFLCLPNPKNKKYHLVLFFGRSVTLVYTFYYFIVFLPYLPFAVVAILAVGAGFLMLTPLVLIMIHAKELANDFRWLKQQYATGLLWAVLSVGFLIIPTIITINYLNDRKTLHSTLDYLYQPDYSNTAYHINTKSLKKTIRIVKEHKRRNLGFIFRNEIPYLASYFNWLVLDNLTLSNEKIGKIEKIFFDKKNTKPILLRTIAKDDVQITNIKTNSTYDAKQNAWRTWVDLEITNNEDRDFQEYVTTFELPDGSWISDYYLYVGDRKEMGILSEKKTAMWVYSNITSRRRDPGILHYLTGNRIAFRVYPFAENEVRKTGIEILHKTPIELTIDKQQVKLGEQTEQQNLIFENECVAYITSDQKQQLKQVYRKPYLHFLVDCSSNENINSFIQNIEKLTNQNPKLVENAKISFVNSYVKTQQFNADWRQQLHKQNFEGGFYIDRAIKSVLYDAYESNTPTYPIIVTVTDSIESAIFDKDFLNWQFAFPENNKFYNLKEGGVLNEHSLISNPKNVIKEKVLISLDHPVLEYQLDNGTIAHLTKNNKPSLIVKAGNLETEKQNYQLKNWASAVAMQANWTTHLLHPENKSKTWLGLVKQSFQTQVMAPVTSYLALENDAQKAMLKKKQKQVLASNPSLDLGDEVQQMSEPGLVLLSILLLLFLWFRRNRILKSKRLFNHSI